ncbi:hypothetical protein MRX96_056568 [Rhipicephalus microplus]
MGAVLPCSAQGQPHPIIRWEKEDGSPATSVPGLREIRSDGSLALPAFSASQFRPEVHLTTYRCVASNSFGLVKSRLTHVRGVVVEKFMASVYDAYVVPWKLSYASLPPPSGGQGLRYGDVLGSGTMVSLSAHSLSLVSTAAT